MKLLLDGETKSKRRRSSGCYAPVSDKDRAQAAKAINKTIFSDPLVHTAPRAAQPHIVRFGSKMFRKCTCSDLKKKFFPDSVWYWRLEISDKKRPLYAQCTVVFIEPEQTQLFSADFIR